LIERNNRINLNLVLQLKKTTIDTTRNIEELIIKDTRKQPHSIYQKRITGVK
jgi:hypothetical protein